MAIEGLSSHADKARFLQIYHYGVNIDRRMGSVLGLLWNNSAALGIVNKESASLHGHKRAHPLYSLLAIAFHCIVARCLVRLRLNGRWLQLPDEGEVSIHCFPDYVRIFDLERCRITNCFDERQVVDVREVYGEMLEFQPQLGRLGLAPRIYADEITADRYVEEYCPGTPLYEAPWWRKEVFDKVCSAAVSIQSLVPPKEGSVDQMARTVRDGVDSMRSTPSIGSDSVLVDRISSTVDWAVGVLGATRRLTLTLSHGDLARRNVVVRKNGEVVFIDWQTVGFRTRNYDIYNYLFSIVHDGEDSRVSREWIYLYLNSVVAPETVEEGRTALAEYLLAYLYTRMKYFVSYYNEDISRLLRSLEQMSSWLAVGDWCVQCYDRDILGDAAPSANDGGVGCHSLNIRQ